MCESYFWRIELAFFIIEGIGLLGCATVILGAAPAFHRLSHWDTGAFVGKHSPNSAQAGLQMLQGNHVWKESLGFVIISLLEGDAKWKKTPDRKSYSIPNSNTGI